MFTLLLLITNVDDCVNKGYCGILLEQSDSYFCALERKIVKKEIDQDNKLTLPGVP